jgi:hypothetical protein
MTLIWLYLAGIVTFFSGRFSSAEVVLTLVIGLCSAVGLVACVTASTRAKAPIRLLASASWFCRY